MDAETRAAHAAHARHVATGEVTTPVVVDRDEWSDIQNLIVALSVDEDAFERIEDLLEPIAKRRYLRDGAEWIDKASQDIRSGDPAPEPVPAPTDPVVSKMEIAPAPTVDAGPVPVERILDPDYARIYTQARIVAWQYGWALLAHGSKSRDLDLLLVPWEVRAFDPDFIVLRIADVAGLTIQGPPSEKPHGRKSWSLMLPGFSEVRWVDLSAMTALAKLEPNP